jgi:hypothetical protein
LGTCSVPRLSPQHPQIKEGKKRGKKGDGRGKKKEVCVSSNLFTLGYNKSLNEAAADKIRKYRADYNNNPPNVISFMPAMASTSVPPNTISFMSGYF